MAYSRSPEMFGLVLFLFFFCAQYSPANGSCSREKDHDRIQDYRHFLQRTLLLGSQKYQLSCSL